jgi:hypothetical protein
VLLRGSRSTRRLAAALAISAAALILLAASPSSAIERQHHLGLSPQLASLKVKDKSTLSVGGGGAIHYTFGLTDAWNLVLEGASAIVAADQQQDFPESPRNRPAAVDSGSVGVSYVIDILRWVPYIGVMGGVYRLSGGTLPETLFLPGLALTAGIDYQLSRHFAVGLGLRQHLMVSRLETYPSYTTVVLRFEYMWGY